MTTTATVTQRASGSWRRFLAALASLVVVAAGVPAGLITVTYLALSSPHPLPGIDTTDEIRSWLDRELSSAEIAPVLLRVLLVVAWLLWIGLMVSILSAVTASRPRLGGLRLPRLAIFDGVATWIAAGLTALSSLAPTFPHAGHAAAAPAPIVLPVDTAVPHTTDLLTTRDGFERVQQSESIEMFAARTLGDSGRWTEIWELNKQREVDSAGTTWDQPWRVMAGWELELPASVPNREVPVGRERTARESTMPAKTPGAADPATYVVQSGDGPWDVAEALLGDGARFQELLDANIGREVAPGVVWSPDQRVIHPGWVFRWGAGEPPDETPAPTDTAAVRVVVERGDTLSGLVDEHTDGPVTPDHVAGVAERNDGTATPDGAFVFDSHKPDLIHPGQEFVIEPSGGERASAQTNGDANAEERTDRAASTPLAPAPPLQRGPDHPTPADRDTIDAAAVPRDADATEAHPSGTAGVPSTTAAATTPATPIPPPQRPPADTDTPLTTSPPADTPGPSTPVTTSPAAEQTSPTTPAPTSTSTTPPAVADGDSDPSSRGSSRLPAPIGVGAVALATGLLAMLEMSRRRRLRAARTRGRLAEPPPEVVAAERELRSTSDPDRLLRVDIAVRSAAQSLLATPHRVAAVLADPGGDVTVITTGAVELDRPWESTEPTATRWVLPGDVDVAALGEAARGIGAPCAAFAPIGVTPGGSDILVDFEAADSFHIDAEGPMAAAILSGLAAGLATSIFAETAHLIGVGLEPGSFLEHPNQHVAESVGAALDIASDLVGTMPRTADSTFALRARHTSGENWEPAVILVAERHADEIATVLPRPGIVLLTVGGDLPDRWTLRPADEWWVLEPLSLELTPLGVTPDELIAIDELISWEPSAASDDEADEALIQSIWPSAPEIVDSVEVLSVSDDEADMPETSDTPDAEVEPTDVELVAVDRLVWDDVQVDADVDGNPDGDGLGQRQGREIDTDIRVLAVDVSANGAEADAHRNGTSHPTVPEHQSLPADAAIADDLEPEWELMVRVMGLVDVIDRDGQPAHFTKSKSLELLAWLGTHRDRATRAGARSALWDIDVRDATFANVVSEARRGLGNLVEPPPGQEWVGRTLTAALPLNDRVITDVDLIEFRYAQAQRHDGRRAIDHLRSAVELIRGVPFAETGYLWPDAEGTTSRLVVLATSCTADLAEQELDGGNLDGVFRATGVGLQVLPGHEELIGLRMRAHAARGDRAGVRQEWEAYERVLLADPWSDGEPSAKLVQLRHDLLAACSEPARSGVTM